MVRSFVIFLACGSLTACSAASEDPMGSADSADISPDAVPTQYQVTYELEWTGQDQLSFEEDGSWSLTNDLGYEISLEAGYLVTYSSELVECTEGELRQSALDWLMDALVVRAFAGHSEMDPNPAAIKAPLAESLTPPMPQTLGTLGVEPQTYCNVHYLVARSDDYAQWLPEDIDLYRQTLYLRGTYIAPDSTDTVAFEILSALGNGVVSPLYPEGRFGEAEAAYQHTTETGALTVRIRRSLPTLFDQLDFLNMDEEKLARQMLKNVVNNAEVVMDTQERRD